MNEDKTIVYLGAIANFSLDNTGEVCGVKVLPMYAVQKYRRQMENIGYKTVGLTKAEAKKHLKNGCSLKRWTRLDEKIHRGKA